MLRIEVDTESNLLQVGGISLPLATLEEISKPEFEGAVLQVTREGNTVRLRPAGIMTRITGYPSKRIRANT
jgi:hypothetical protein